MNRPTSPASNITSFSPKHQPDSSGAGRAPEPVIMRLTFGQLSMASHVAVMRHTANLLRDARPKYGPLHNGLGWEFNINGCCAELAVARYLNLFWCGTVNDLAARDVGNLVDVRSITKDHHRLMLHETDPDDVPFVSVLSHPPTFELRGWMYAREGKLPEFWEDGDGRPAFFPPNKLLHAMPALRDWVDDHVRGHFVT